MSFPRSRRALFVTAAAVWLATMPVASFAQEMYKVGSPLGLTGYVASVERAWADGLQLAQDHINSNGGILGKKIEIVVEDTRSEPTGAVIAFKKMISSDQVNIFDAGCVSAANFAAAPAVAASKTPMIMCSIPPVREADQKWIFSVYTPPQFEIEVRYRYLKDKTPVRKVGILHDPSPYAVKMKDAGVALAGTFGLEVVDVESYKQDDADLSVQIGRMKAAGAGAIVKIGFGGSTVTAAKNIKALALQDMLLLGSFDDLATFTQAADVLGDRLAFVMPAMMAPETLSPEGKVALAGFKNPWMAKYGDRDGTIGARAWDSMMMIAQAVKAAKSVDGAAVRDALETLTAYQGAFTSYSFAPDNHVGITKNPYVMGAIRDGKVVALK
jgi:branched-chain amino acid transport system substrate-binding protein